MAHENRFEQYDIDLVEKPAPLVPRHLRLAVPERIDAAGEVLVPLDEAAVAAPRAGARGGAASRASRSASCTPTPIPRTSSARARSCARNCPASRLTCRREVCPEIREYERFSTAVANAYVQPLMAGYLAAPRAGPARRRLRVPAVPDDLGRRADHARDRAVRYPIRLVESGPAGGAILAAQHRAAECGLDRVLSFDMGGTTAKICLIDDGEPADRARVRGRPPLPLPEGQRPAVAHPGDRDGRDRRRRRLDRRGRCARPDHRRPGERRLRARARPATAAAAPRPTVTDADLVLGRIDPARFAGGRMPLDRRRGARGARAPRRRAARPRRRRWRHSASARSSTRTWPTPRACTRSSAASDVAGRTLIAFGGAAPLHAARLAEKLGIDRILMPPGAGVGSAIGFLRAPVAYEVVRTPLSCASTDFDAAR